MTSPSDDDLIDTALFQEPEGYFQPEKPATYTSHTLLSGQTLRLRLVGHNPLWGHVLWDAAQVLSDYLHHHAADLVVGKAVLELGAGAGLPSLVCGILGARRVVVTDYPDADLVDNLAHNVAACAPLFSGGHAPARVSVMGFLWGADPAALLDCLVGAGDASPAPASQAGFDLLILADLVFNYSEHGALLATLKATLRRGEAARALVFFTPHRPWLMERDLGFLERCRGEGLLVRGVGEGWGRGSCLRGRGGMSG
ncbi:MAG: hypothetical protein FRX48_08444 [Lasallia pustulata]|uniref:Elongation factor methyltransferase 7 n=1 Tax=Lasallia pustulata TaxID=136370 RepID=A0A5M8PF45_9LECA|nr:MAG: hypothetical protein FRX48_08444 [Lasallia pustulata]